MQTAGHSAPSPVHYEVTENIALITLNNPPVNGLGDSVRRGIDASIHRANTDQSVRAIVIMGAGKHFSGGADIRQFNTPRASAKPMLRDVLRTIEASPKPVIAAIDGVALGGGLELALGCHYRIATLHARLGLPEVNLGLVPGGGGTQRLPRLIGAQAALDIMCRGTAIGSSEALQLGIIDAVTDDSLKTFALNFATTQSQATGHPIISHRSIEDGQATDFSAARLKLDARARHVVAQRAVIDCVEAATRLPFEAGLDEERRLFEQLVSSPESRSLRHLFFSEKGAAKFPGTAALRTVEQVAILGAGTMGAGIAMAFCNAGYSVSLFERDQDALDRGLAMMRRNYEISASKGKLDAAEIQARMRRVQGTLDIRTLATADLVIEAVFEDMAVKQDVFKRLDNVCKPDAILATNTSRLNIDAIAACTTRAQDVIGLHFFSPANVMKLLEVVRGEHTSHAVIATCMDVGRRIGKIPVLVGVCEGFVGNRMLTGYWREANFLLEEGATPEQVDGALTRFGMAMGPLTMADLAGMDINWATRKRLAPTRPKHLRYSCVADRICELGRFGQKTQAGYYRYEPGSRTPVADPIVDDIIARCALEAGITRRHITDEEIVERCILALVNEGAHIVEEGIAQRASDIDVVYVHGYGFPAWRGGPMFYAQTLGLGHTLARISALRAEHGEHWTPATRLARKVDEHALEL